MLSDPTYYDLLDTIGTQWNNFDRDQNITHVTGTLTKEN